jgi:hypothetical protein
MQLGAKESTRDYWDRFVWVAILEYDRPQQGVS